MANRLNRILGVLICLIAAPVWAQSPLPDPTRPPESVSSPTPVTDAEAVTGPVLQSVMIPKKGKPTAIIGGQQVSLGEKYGDSRLIKLTEREAVLEGPSGVEHLLLTPGIERTDIITKSPTAKRVRRGSKP